ncbi:MAG: universal stress protein [Chitinophagales bacterium]
MKPIIATTDFTASSINAVNYAADLASAIGAKLILFHAVQLPVVVSDVPMPEPFYEEMLKAAKHDLKEMREKLAMRNKGKVEIEIEILPGSVSHELKEICDQRQPFAIVMGRGAGRSFEQLIIGSETFFAIKQLNYPILVVPESATYKGIKKIGLACDLEADDNALPFAQLKELLLAFNPTLDVIHILPKEKVLESGQVAESISLQNHLNVFRPNFHFLSNEKVDEGLSEFAKQHELDLLIVFPRKHDFFGLFHKRVSKSLILHHQLPIMTMRGS